jgi:two-component system, cell cycle sensor histidine kinase and response regulator CckA
LLTQAASGVTAGDRSKLVNIRTNDEFGTLANAFNEMIVKVGTSQEDLERKVQERTLELERANDQLQRFSESNALKRSQAEKEAMEAIEALRSSEEQLQQAQKLEAVGRLAGGIAHDFNNLLTVIMGYSALLTKRKLEKGVHEKIEEINKAAHRASSLTRQLLAFSRKQVLKPEVLDINSLIEGTGKMLRRLIGEDIEVITSLKPGLGKINADPGQIEQVLINLVVNARDAMKDGGKITIETANVELDPAYSDMHIKVTSGPYVMLAVSDTGIGMNPETRTHIFEPFFTTKEVGRGTGLGLSMIYGIVKQSGGNIWVYSELGKGTTFKIYLPRVRAESDQAVTAVKQQDPNWTPATETILLVEDEEMVRKLASEILRDKGYQVLVGENGEEAIRICREHKGQIDVMLTDVVMPAMNGKRLAESVGPIQPNMRVIYMSGYTDEAIVHHGVLDQGTNFIEKPFTAETLTSRIREVLRKSADPNEELTLV